MPNITQHTFTVEGVMPSSTYNDLQAVLVGHPTAGEVRKREELEACRGAITHLAARLGIHTINIFEALNSDGKGTNYAALADDILNFKKS